MKLFNLRIVKIRNSWSDLIKEIRQIDRNTSNIGYAFVHPLLSHSYDLRVGRKVYTDKGIGSITSYNRDEHTAYIYLDKVKYQIQRHVNQLYIIAVLTRANKYVPLSPHVWEYIEDKLKASPTSFQVEYRGTTHGNVTLTDKFIKQCQKSES
jgi:hypothetical protein